MGILTIDFHLAVLRNQDLIEQKCTKLKYEQSENCNATGQYKRFIVENA